MQPRDGGGGGGGAEGPETRARCPRPGRQYDRHRVEGAVPVHLQGGTFGGLVRVVVVVVGVCYYYCYCCFAIIIVF